MSKCMFFGGVVGLLTTGVPQSACAQTAANPIQPWGSWFIGTVQLPGSSGHRWGGFVEGQVRTNALFRQYFYNELKGGVSFDFDRNVTVLLGGGRYATSDYQNRAAGPLSVEKRLWQQLVLTQYASRLRLEHRYRAEQRWFAFRDDSTGFRQRLRYRLNLFVPLNQKSIGPRTAFLSVYDEIFLNPAGPVFERNRVYAGAGYQFNRSLTLQIGLLHQANYNVPTFSQGQYIPQFTSAKRNVVVALAYRLIRPSAEAAPERLPSQQD